jgi:tagatose 1,6-diphosphate aldolase
MDRPSIGKLRGLQQLVNKNGILAVCAIDHRDSLTRALNKKNPEAVGYQEIVNFKVDLCQAVAGFASAVLLDPIYGAAQAIVSGALAGNTGLLVSLEKTGYTGESTARLTELIPDWNVKKIKKLGASAVKLLIYFRVDLEEAALKQLALVKKIARQCIDEDIPLLVESVTYPTAEEKSNPEIFSKKKPELVIEAARRLTSLPIDVLKSEFPADMDYETDITKLEMYCKKLSQASQLPWALLSAGTNFEGFKKAVEIACRNGASGFVAGRALWQEATHISSREDRRTFFKNQTVARLIEVTRIADRWASPCSAKSGGHNRWPKELTEDWYKKYQ